MGPYKPKLSLSEKAHTQGIIPHFTQNEKYGRQKWLSKHPFWVQYYCLPKKPRANYCYMCYQNSSKGNVAKKPYRPMQVAMFYSNGQAAVKLAEKPSNKLSGWFHRILLACFLICFLCFIKWNFSTSENLRPAAFSAGPLPIEERFTSFELGSTPFKLGKEKFWTEKENFDFEKK